MAIPPRIAIAVIMALAAAMAVGCAASGSPATSGASTAASSGTPSGAGEPIPSSVPRDYVTIDPVGAQRLIVRSTATGAVVAMVSAPHGTRVLGVYGSDNDQVFALGTAAACPGDAGFARPSLLPLLSQSAGCMLLPSWSI